MSTTIKFMAVGLSCGVLLGSGATVANADAASCGTLEAWQQWAAANKSNVSKGYRHLGKVKKALKREKVSAIAYNLLGAGDHFAWVTDSPDGVAGTAFRAAGKDFRKASNGMTAGNVKFAVGKLKHGYGNLTKATDAVTICYNTLSG